MKQRGKLFFFCGKMAAGKSTLAREIAQREGAILIEQDELLSKLFPDEITDIPSFVKYSSRLKTRLQRIYAHCFRTAYGLYSIFLATPEGSVPGFANSLNARSPITNYTT
jgi:hypothetical protein